jgi:hypothetical protein
MNEESIPLAEKLREAAEHAKISQASLCAKCEKTCPKVSAIITKYTEEYNSMQNELEALRKQIPKRKQNLLGAGRKPKVTPKIIEAVLLLRSENMSFGDISNTINGLSDIKISKSTAYEIYEKHKPK